MISAVLFCLADANAQFEAGNLHGIAAGNYTSYRGAFKQSAMGIKFGLGYDFKEKASTNLTYLMGFGIKVPTTFIATNSFGDQINVKGNYTVKISAITLMGNYFFAGSTAQSFGFYGTVGASYVSATTTGAPSEDYDKNYTLEDISDKAHGFTINGGLGIQKFVGPVIVYLDGGISFPANTVNGQAVSNPIPTSFNGNLGVKIPFGKKDMDK